MPKNYYFALYFSSKSENRILCENNVCVFDKENMLNKF
jgi:hypothetical protein